MFTGIIEEIGIVKQISRGLRSAALSITANAIFADLAIGNRFEVDVASLTASASGETWFSADVMPETLAKSALGALAVGSCVNLERAMSANGRFGGHIVTGHIDGMGEITALRRDENAIWIDIAADKTILRYIVQKGSVAIDGISLTVAATSPSTFAVSIIPHTARETTLVDKKMGNMVNIEVDILGKYVEKLLTGKQNEKQSALTMDFLAQHGFGG